MILENLGDCTIILRNILRKPECTPKQLNRLVRDGPCRHGVNAAILNEKKPSVNPLHF